MDKRCSCAGLKIFFPLNKVAFFVGKHISQPVSKLSADVKVSFSLSHFSNTSNTPLVGYV